MDEKLKFLKSQLTELEANYQKYLENDEPYYGLETFGYYKNIFSQRNIYGSLDLDFTFHVISLMDGNRKPSETANIMKRIVKACK